MIRVKELVCILVVFFLFVFFLPVATFAQEQGEKAPGHIKAGNLIFYPSFAVYTGYTDNVFLEAEDEESSYLAIFSPGIGIELPARRHLLQAQYRADIIRYSKFKDQLNRVDHTLDTLLKLDFPMGLDVNLGYNFMRKSIPAYSEEEEKKRYDDNIVTATVLYNFADRYKLELNCSHKDRDFKEDFYWQPSWSVIPIKQSDSYKKDAVSSTLYYRFLPKTSILFELGYYRMDNNDPTGPSTDNDNYRTWLGFHWKPAAKLAGTLKGGYIARRYDKEAGGHNVDDFGLSCDLTYNYNQFNRFILKAYREVLGTYLSTKTTPYYGSNYIHSGFKLSYSHDFTYKLSGALHALYNNDKFTQKGEEYKKREDNRGGGGVSIDYQMREGLFCRLAYAYLNNNSNFNVEDYKENKISFLIVASF